MIVMTHHLTGEGYPAMQGAVTVEQLESVIKQYPQATYTFDDGTADQRLSLPILKKYGTKAIFFLSNRIEIERDKFLMNKLGLNQFYDLFFQCFPYCKMPIDFLAGYDFYSLEDRRFRYIRDFQDPNGYRDFMDTTFTCEPVPELFLHPSELSDHVLGAHSYSHPADMGRLKPSEQFDQWMMNIEFLQQFQEKITMASHPMGRYSGSTLRVLKLLGITEAFCSKTGDGGPLEIGRMDIKHLL